MDCIIVDDNKLAREGLKQLIANVSFLNLKKECEGSIEAFNYLQNEKTDLMFLDVEMPGMTGLEFIKNLDKRPVIILVSVKKDYAVEAFELNVADYLVKPILLSRFMLAVQRAHDLFESKEVKIEPIEKDIEHIFIRNKSVLTKIKLDDILYIQALGDYVNIFTANHKFTIHTTLVGIEHKLPSNHFLRIHRSYIVALNHIDRIEEGTAFIEKTSIPIGEQFKSVLLKKLNFI